MTQPETEIRASWRHIAGNHYDGYIDDVLARYAEPHRHYHTATHIMFVLRCVRDVSAASAMPLSPEVMAAALYHDAIYDPRSGDNEANSASLATRDLGAIGWTADRCGFVAAMIVATAGHLTDDAQLVDGHADEHNSSDTAMLLDADLAILGADPGAYQAYVNGVRAEYSHVDDIQWHAGRTAVLARFLQRERLFLTDFMHATYEHRAQANIEAELAALRAG